MVSKRPNFVVIGIIEKPRGLKGEVKIKPLTDHPDRFKRLSDVYLENKFEKMEPIAISKVSVCGSSVYAFIEGISNREQAQKLAGCYLSIKYEDVLPLPSGQFYHFQLEGLRVETESGCTLGEIKEVLDLSANDVLVVREGDKERLIPYIKDVILKVDIDGGVVVINPIEGLLD